MPPPQLLSPAGLPGLDMYGAASDDSSPIMEHHNGSSSMSQYLDVSSLPGAGGRNGSNTTRHPSTSRPFAAPPLKRTASTASVNEHIMDMLNPHKQAEEIARMNGNSSKSRKGRSSSVLSSDSEDGIGTLEDWEIEQGEDSPVAGQKRRRPMNDDNELDEKDPFMASPPVSGSSMRLDSRDAGEGPSSSPTIAVQKRRRSGGLHSRTMLDDSDNDMDDADNNPFLDRPSTAPPKAPSKNGSKVDHKKKISYVFRGKRITYDAPLDSLFQDDEDDEALNLHMKSGPRVLFPSPPTPAPVASPSHSTPRKQVNLSPESRPPISLHLMQTPRRQSVPTASGSGASDMTLVDSTPQVRLMNKDGKVEATGERKRGGKQEPIAPFIPPTPASLPQKSQKSEEQRQLERERLANAMQGIQAAHSAINNAHRGGQGQRRYAPYPPR